jgi:hypothetical protein
MNIAMSTKYPKSAKIKPGETTEFQMHKSQLMAFAGMMHLVLDYTEYRLKHCIDKTRDEQQKSILQKLLKEYVSGDVAVAWKRGQPIWIKVTKA